MKNRRFFWQIFPAAILIIIISFAAAGWYGTRMVQSFHYSEMRKDIQDRSILLRPHVNLLLRDNIRGLQDFCRTIGRAASTRITVINGDGTVLADSNENPAQMDNHGKRPEIVQAFSGTTGSSLRFSKTLQQNMLYVAIPLIQQAPEKGVLRLSVSVATLDTVLAVIHKKIMYGIFCIGLVAAALSYYLARRISRPLEEMRRGAERMVSGETDQPILIKASSVPREMAELSHALNHMAGQLNSRIRIISQQRNELEAVFGSMNDGVLALAHDHRIIRMNRAAAELFHVDHKAVQGVAFEGVLRNRVLQKFLNDSLCIDDALARDLCLIENGQQVNLRCHAHPLQDGENTKMGSLVVINDLTRINQLENIRQSFVANVSHELKTPITAIRGYVETLLDGAIDDAGAAVNFLGIIHKQAVRLDAIVDDLLTLARIEDTTENNAMELREEEIKSILETAVQTCSVSAQQKNITFTLRCIPENLKARLNRPMVEQAVINLLTNAVTYSPEDSTVSLSAEIVERENGEKNLCLQVQDEGPGIASEHQKRIFERFYRCDKARSREHGGTGLGLAIVKHIAESHNGTVELQSTLGEGSLFTLILPAP